MQIVSKQEFLERADEFHSKILEGAVFIYPTDTIYGIGCNALLGDAVMRIRTLKERDEKPFSVIAPSKEWIRENCEILFPEELNKLPGPYTFVMKIKEKCVSKETNAGLATLGVRIPDHWFSEFVEKMNIPVITTSVNKSGADYMTDMDNCNKEILKKVDFIIYEGKKSGRPSTMIIMTGSSLETKER
ncbi:MAG: L-threonylcarbamoyladenylate synthase [archaeon]